MSHAGIGRLECWPGQGIQPLEAGGTPMRKRIIDHVQKTALSSDQDWLNVERLVEVEITSEDAAHPIESALLPGRGSGWRAAASGKQTIRLLFTHSQRLRLHGTRR
jgi:hypothetical protein